ncbi:MAG TPA: sigma-54 dependent transcriptional regulator [Urbifossiella sp.]|jgi:two-component system nitrogen regulation response regulator GlnG|nr:sigma-54 dependent transcriptional regulator [Urbifossiella sp.]
MPKLLVVDDEPVICQSFQWVFGPTGVEVLTAGTVADGWRQVQRERPDVIVLDLQLPDGSGMDLFERVRAADPKRPVVFVTAHGTTDTAIEAMKRGAFDYLSKPLDLDQITALLGRAFEAARLMREPAALPDDPAGDRIVGRSRVVQEMCKQIGRVAPQDVNALILGESGVGKELVARAIYQHSRRADRPFLAINCAAIPEGLVESELFGHERGAFTGADRQRVGKFEQADGGTLLLDEIGDMPLPVQAKMLRLLQEQQFERVGGHHPISTRVRVLAATNQNLDQLIAAGRFRGDLYYRLKEVHIRVPPLRDRREDIPELAHHFLFRFAREADRDVRGFSPDVLNVFQMYSWPGNVRELRGVVKEAALQTTGPLILPEFLPPDLSRAQTTGAGLPVGGTPLGGLDLVGDIEAQLRDGAKGMYGRVMGSVERELLTRVLRHAHGHQGRACELLGIDRKTLRHKLRELGIAVDRVVTERPEPPE